MGIEIIGGEHPLLTEEALAFLADLEREFRDRREELLARRQVRQNHIDGGEFPDFLDATATIRDSDWRVGEVPSDLADRRVEITGPVDAKMMINALNSGANVFMADFEDATTPTWSNLLDGQQNLIAAYRRTLTHKTEAKSYRMGPTPATLMIRPRGWHLSEKNVLVDGERMSASLFDFGLYLFWGGRVAIEEGSGPYLYIPKLQDHLEARLWNDVFERAQAALGITNGTVKVTVLIETILAAFEMEEILYELRDHIVGMNAGRWDYLFSMIKTFRNHAEFVLPDRSQITMTVPFMHAYTELQVATCHRRGAHAIGGMSAFIPNRRDPDVTAKAIEQVAEGKRREARQGCDGTWVAHPDLVTVAKAEFDAVLGDRPNQVGLLREDVSVSAKDLLGTSIEGAAVTRGGLVTNIRVGMKYLQSWLSGQAAVGIDNLMEDAATAEISRSQVWQWVRHRVAFADGGVVDKELVEGLIEVQFAEMRGEPQAEAARDLFRQVALSEEFIEFLTLPAYELID